MVTIKKRVALLGSERKELERAVDENADFVVRNETAYHESLFSDVVCEGYFVRHGGRTFILDFEDYAKNVDELLDVEDMSKDDIQLALSKQLTQECRVFEKGIEYGKMVKQAEIKSTLGL